MARLQSLYAALQAHCQPGDIIPREQWTRLELAILGVAKGNTRREYRALLRDLGIIERIGSERRPAEGYRVVALPDKLPIPSMAWKP